MIVREDDTMVCEPCYADDCEQASPFDLPQHRWSHARIDFGVCESCGQEASAGRMVDSSGEFVIQSSDKPFD